MCLVMLIRRSERLAEERSRFAAAAAHELRTPLAGIRLFGEMLALSLGNRAKVNEYAGRITDEAERLTRLVSNVFNYTQVDQKRLRIQNARPTWARWCARRWPWCSPSSSAAGATLVIRVEEGLPPVELDADAVHQMVRNLVDNAEKYSRQSADRRIEVTVSAGTRLRRDRRARPRPGGPRPALHASSNPSCAPTTRISRTAWGWACRWCAPWPGPTGARWSTRTPPAAAPASWCACRCS